MILSDFTLKELFWYPEWYKCICIKEFNREKGWVYFVKTRDGQIKIGKTKRPSTRLKELSVKYGGVDGLLLLNNNITNEKEIFHRFSKYRNGGELFKPSKELMNFINKF